MKLIYLIFPLLLLITLTTYAQIDSAKMKGQIFCQEGDKLLKIEKYKEADSLLTLALIYIKNADVYFNRGVSRFYLNDTTGFCDDMSIAAYKYVDINAAKLFNEFCCYKVDTLYYNRDFNKIPTSSGYRYLEEIQHIKNTNITKARIHERNAKNFLLTMDAVYGQKLPQASTFKIDIIGEYILSDSTKYFNFTSKPACFFEETASSELDKRIKEDFSIKYKDLKNQDTTQPVIIYYDIWVSCSGDVTDCKLTAIYPKTLTTEMEAEIKNDISNLVKIYPKLKPALFEDEKVCYILTNSITF